MGEEVWTVGDVRITKIHEITLPAAACGFYLECTPAELERDAWWSQPHFIDADGNVQMSVHALVVESLGRRIVVDTCVGNGRERPFPGWGGLHTDFMDRFVAAEFDLATI